VQHLVLRGGLLVRERVVRLKGVVVVATLGMLVATRSGAQENRAAARAAYEAGTLAYGRGDYAAAAARYAEADALLPSPVALQAAIDAAVKADDPLIGAELLDRARTRAVSGALQVTVDAATAKLGHRAGRVTATCASPCTVTLDGSPFDANRPRWVTAGTHTIGFSVEGRFTSRSIDVAADADASVAPPDRPPEAEPPVPIPLVPVVPTPAAAPDPRLRVTGASSRPRGLAPGWFWASAGVTAGLGIASGVLLGVTKATHDTFLAQACSTATTASCASLSSRGTTTMIAGDALLAGAAIGAVWTTVAGASLVRWSSPVEVAPVAHGALAFWRVTF
jgi:hypothetical protein